MKLVVDVNKLDSERCKELIKIVKNNKGKQHFSVAFVDDENNMSCMMNAQKEASMLRRCLKFWINLIMSNMNY